MLRIYGQEGCTECERMKRVLLKNKLEFEYWDVHDPELDKDIAASVMTESLLYNRGLMPIIEMGGHLYGAAAAIKHLDKQYEAQGAEFLDEDGGILTAW